MFRFGLLLSMGFGCFLMSSATAHAEGLDSFIKAWKRSRLPDTQMAALESLASCSVEAESDEARRLTHTLAEGLKVEDLGVRCTAARLLGKAPSRSAAVTKLSDALKKHENKYKKAFKLYVKNSAKMIKLMERDTSKTALQDLNVKLKLLRQYIDSLVDILRHLEESREFSADLVSGLRSHPTDISASSLKTYFRKVHKYSPKDSVPAAEALLHFGARSGVQRVAEAFLSYDYTVARREKLKYEARENREAYDEFVDWGQKLHDGFVALAKRKKLDQDLPEFGIGVEQHWNAWFTKHRDSFQPSIESK